MVVSGLLLFSKTEELFYKVYPTFNNYPRSEKFSTVEHIKDTFLKLLSYIQLAATVKSKAKVYVQEADGRLQMLKMLYRLSVKRKFISSNFYEDISIALTEINKLLVGFIKSLYDPNYKSSFKDT